MTKFREETIEQLEAMTQACVKNEEFALASLFHVIIGSINGDLDDELCQDVAKLTMEKYMPKMLERLVFITSREN